MTGLLLTRVEVYMMCGLEEDGRGFGRSYSTGSP